MQVNETLRVRNWGTHFESYRTRGLRNLRRIRVPIVLESEGYRTLLSHKSGGAHYGAWMAIVLVASQCNPRGTLLRDNGNPHTAASLAAMTGLPGNLVAESIPRLLEIGWLEVVRSGADAKLANCRICQEDAPLPNGTMPEPCRTVSGSDGRSLPSVMEEERTK
jgi:hypothetical protein